jgi:hypothetical protein
VPSTGSRYNPQTGEFLPSGSYAQPTGGQVSTPQENPLAAIGRMLGIGSPAPGPVAPAATAGGPSIPIAGQQSDMAQTPEQQEIFRARQALRAQEQTLTSQIAGTSNIELAKALAAQRQQLSTHDQQLEQLYIGTLRQTRTLDDSELTKAEKDAGGEWQVDASGNRSIVGGTESDSTRAPNDEETARLVAAGRDPKDYQVSDGKLEPISSAKPAGTTEIQNYEFDQQNRKAQGLPPISFSDWNTQKTMYGKGERPLVDAQGKEIDSNTTGDELLQALPPAVANHAKAIAEIREKWPSGTEQARQPQLQQALAAAQQLDPSLNQQTYQTRQSMKNSAEAGSGRINVANLANNTALFHSSTLADAITALDNSNNTVLNAAINSGSGMAGGLIPGAVNKADAVKQFSVARDAVANELERSFHGVGTTAEQAVKRQIDDLSVNDAPQTQLGALKAAQDLLKGKITANEADYKDTMGDKNIAAWERDHGRPFGFITPAAQSAGDRVASMYESIKAGRGFHGFEPQAAQSPAPPQAAPPRNVAPGVTGDPLAAARAAISKGAPRDKVIQRLQQNGIDPGGL